MIWSCTEPVADDGHTDDRRKERKERPSPRFHGRVEGTGRVCMWRDCEEPGKFRAPPLEGPSEGGPPQFEGLNRVARQRLVNQALANLLSTKIHALAIKARAPGEI